MQTSAAIASQNDAFRVTADGFAVVREGERVDYRDESIAGIRFVTKREAGVLGEDQLRQELRLRLIVDGKTEFVTVSRELGPFDDDRLAEFRQRILFRLVERSWDELRRGSEVHGDGWSLDLIGFTDHTSGTHCYLQQLSGASWDVDHLLLRHEDYPDRPFIKLPVEGENTRVLYHLLKDLVENVEVGEPDSAIGLGELCATFQTHHRHPLPFRKLAGVASVALSALLCTLSLHALAVALLLVLVVAVAAVPLLRSFTEVLRHYEHGLIWSSGRHEHVMLFEQIDRMRVRWDGGERRSTLTQPTALFEFAEDDPSQMPLRMPIVTEGRQRRQAESLQSAVSAHLADRMSVRLNVDGQVQWTSRVTLFRDALVYSTPDIEKRVPLDQIAEAQVNEHRLTLVSNDGESLLKVATAEWNFYPGFMLIEMMCGFRKTAV